MCIRCLDLSTSFLGPDFQTFFRKPIEQGPVFIDSRQAGEAIFDHAFMDGVRAGQFRYLVIEGAPGEAFGPWRALVGALSAEIDRLDDTKRRVLANLVHGRDHSLPLLNTHHALYRTFDAVRQLLDQASRATPLAILIHRLDRSDQASFQLLSFLSPFLADMRVFVATTVDAGDDACIARIRGSFPHASFNMATKPSGSPSDTSSFKTSQATIGAHPISSGTPAGTVSSNQWVEASMWARSIGAIEFAGQYLNRCLASTSDADFQWTVLIDLIKIHAEAGQDDEAERYLALWLEHTKTGQCDHDQLSGLALAFFDAGLDRSLLSPLIRQFSGSRQDVTWARVELLEPPRIASVASGRVTQGRWLGANQKAIHIVRELGSEDDFARTLYVYDWWSKEELDGMLAMSRNWKSLSGRSRALSVAAETLMYRHGEFARACALLEEQVHMHMQTGWLEEQAKSLVRLSMALLANGELDRADETRARARETVWRLGPDYLIYEHAGTKSGGDLYPEISMESNFAWYREGDWLAVAEHWAMAVAMHEGAGSPVHIVEAAMTAQAYARLGRFDDARVYLDELVAILPQLRPRDWAFNGAVGRASHAIWDMLDDKYAAPFLDFTEALLADGVGDWTNTSLELSAARMAALLGRHASAIEYFSKARRGLNESQAPQRGIVDYDEAIALRLAGDLLPERRQSLLASAIKCFAANRMGGWHERAKREAEV